MPSVENRAAADRSERADVAKSAEGPSARRSVDNAASAVELAAAAQEQLQRLNTTGPQADAELMRDLRNAPGGLAASKESMETSATAIGQIADAHERERETLSAAVAEAAAAPERAAAGAERDDTIQSSRSAIADELKRVDEAQASDRTQAMTILVRPDLSADQRAEALQGVAAEATRRAQGDGLDLDQPRDSADRTAATLSADQNDGLDLDQARENADRTAATLSADQDDGLDMDHVRADATRAAVPLSTEQAEALRSAAGPVLGPLLDQSALERVAGAAAQDAKRGTGALHLEQQLVDELAALTLLADDRAVAVRYSSEATRNLSQGNLGEKLAADALARRGFEIAAYKPDVRGTNQGGIDIVAMKKDQLYLFDNKALNREGNVSSVSALTTNLEQNIRKVAEEFVALRDARDSNAGQRDMARRVLEAIANDRITLAVTNANVARDGVNTTAVAGKAKNAGLRFVDVMQVDPDNDPKPLDRPGPLVDEESRKKYAGRQVPVMEVDLKDVRARAADMANKLLSMSADNATAMASARSTADEALQREALRANTEASERAARAEGVRQEVDRIMLQRSSKPASTSNPAVPNP